MAPAHREKSKTNNYEVLQAIHVYLTSNQTTIVCFCAHAECNVALEMRHAIGVPEVK